MIEKLAFGPSLTITWCPRVGNDSGSIGSRRFLAPAASM
jgi:hypothetical protein